MRAKHMRPGLWIILGFLAAILLGTALLLLPISIREGAHLPFVDALFTSTSAVCVTGLLVVDTADTFTIFGRTVVALLIQIGGLGVSSIGAGAILLMRRRIGLHERQLIQTGLNLDTPRGAVRLVRAVLLMTLAAQCIGMLLSYPVFARDHAPLSALGIAAFHSIAAFNTAGFDILGGMHNLMGYQDSVLLNLTTAGLILWGGIGFLVVIDVAQKRRFRRLTLHSKVVLTTTAALLVIGTLLLRLTENIGWLGAFFTGVSARTAGFSTYSLGGFSSAGLFIVILLMFIGASPGSTGGGVKTTTFFAAMLATYAMAANKHPSAFKRRLPRETLYKAFVIITLSVGVCALVLLLLCLLEPQWNVEHLLFEAVSAFATVGLSTGITPELGIGAKLLLTLTMYIGRLGPLTVASLLTFRELPALHYSEESIPIG
ncbi:MAG: H(+)-transporting ATPase [Oscillospiraceae bacterium]|nr:H(+)-transporting ATPase [Oscillospiraceae bacterium]